MDHPGTRVLTWTLICVFLSWMSVTQAAPGMHYMVTFPAVLEAGAETQICGSVLMPNESVRLTVTLRTEKENKTLIKDMSTVTFHSYTKFKVPLAHNEVAELEVDVQGQTFHRKEIKKVMIKTYQPMTFIQTDKPIYLPGQTVNFRVVTIDTKFRPASLLVNFYLISSFFSLRTEQDPNHNKIEQWLNQTSNGKILQLSYSLHSEASEGTYHVTLQIGQDKLRHSFKVEKYVLPKFEVTINALEKVNIGQEVVKVEVCGKYTYGQSVPGEVHIEMCRPFYSYLRMDTEGVTAPCVKETKKADKSGCATFDVMMSNFKNLDPKYLQNSLHLVAKVEEEGTEITHQLEKYMEISFVIARLAFIETPKIYEQGSDVVGKVKAVHYNDTPIPDMTVYLFEGNRWEASKIQQLTTDSNGVATFRYSTAESKQRISLWASDKEEMEGMYSNYQSGHVEAGHHVVSLAQEASPTVTAVSSLQVQTKDKPIPCDTEEDITVKYTIVGEKWGSADLIYVILSRGAIIKQGDSTIPVQLKTVTEGQMSIKLLVSPEMAPEVQVLVYAILPSETVIAHSAEFVTERCFRNKVSLEFSPSSAVPGEENILKVTANPGSLCGLSAVDQSVLIKEPGKTLDIDKIFDLLPIQKLSYIPYEAQDPEECLVVRSRRYVSPSSIINDVFRVFQNVGLKIITNLNIKVPTCVKYNGREYFHGRDDDGIVAMSYELESDVAFVTSALEPIETVRTFFPETWIWSLVETGETGTKDVPLTVPDTITTWETEAFCLSPQGFGLAPRKKLTVFQPFFLELHLPYSIIRGENFELKATVFNYLNSCIMVTVTPAPSSDYTLTPRPEDEYTTCLCSNNRKTFRWTLAPTALGDVSVSVTAEALESHITCSNEVVTVPERGRIDTVSRRLKVKAEGIERTMTSNWLLCPKDEILTEETEIELPVNVVDGSSRALVSVIGDILGRALNNLDGLLQMPYGCGEQNMALMAPNIYILQYLKDTNQLTPAVRETGISYLVNGYQGQMNYKHYNGAYSTFGSGTPNTWLTTFVMRCFSKAQNFIFIDPDVINKAKEWLVSKQQSSGCYELQGNLFNKAMKGGVSDEVTISAYITAAFLEMNSTITESVSKSLSCLKKNISDLSNTYATALQAYTFTLAGDMETRATLLAHLDNVAIKHGGFIHWSQTATDSSSSLSVEISSYVLLALLSASPSIEDLGYANQIVRWLTTQQNYYGGFSSTQDTVVALQALALYSTLVFNPEGSSSVTVQSPSGQLDFVVNQENKLLYQEQLLTDVTGKYKVEVKGTTCASVQISHHYNILSPPTETNLRLDTVAKANCESNNFTLTLKMICTYTGNEVATNMVILDIKMLSGFVPEPQSLKMLKDETVERIDQKDDHILLYIKELRKEEPEVFTLQLLQKYSVSPLKAAPVQIYDYYQPGWRLKCGQSSPPR
ncbi:alpha-2-macroglobulin-like [Xyrichtys novacula]|uniref:Alpha-2-macroglobulin-like n=1 Tax=Xyrichtys novacula TaxID=13765 RepID=A0AAV1FZZ7_XYRNO|nr:alpha-2-macroglobulin-like [Xyrichtys novacula]